MSLAQHVTQVEGFDYQGLANPQISHDLEQDAASQDPSSSYLGPLNIKSEWRRLSFAPAEPTIREPHIAAYKVSDARRCVQVVTGVVACWLASGIVFGFAALKPVLVAEGVYRELCDADEAGLAFDIPCPEQDLRLNFFFVAASITANVSSLFAGTALDRYGRRACWLCSCVFLAAGCLLMGSSFAIPKLDGYLLGNILIALGGTFLFVSSFQLAYSFPKYSGLIVALITGAFDASAAVYLFYRMTYDATDGRFSLEAFYLGYTVVPVLILVAELAYMPSHSYHTIGELEQRIEKVQDRARDIHDSDEDIADFGVLTKVRSARADRRQSKLGQIEELAGDAEHREERVKAEEERQEASGVWGVLHGVAAHRQMLTPWFVLILLLTVLQMLRMNYFIATIRSQYRHMLDSEGDAETINQFFDIALPVGGVASTPFIGLMLNNTSVPSMFAVLTVFVATIGVLNCLPYMWAGYATVVAFVVFRPFYYSAISDYATKVFGFATFGRIYGTIVCLSGLVNFAQSGLDALTHRPLHGDPTPINFAMGVGGVIISSALTIFVTVKGRVFVKEKSELEGDMERRTLLGEEDEGYGT